MNYRTKQVYEQEEDERRRKNFVSLFWLIVIVGGTLFVTMNYRYEDVFRFIMQIWKGG